MGSGKFLVCVTAGFFLLILFVGLQAGYINNLVVLRDGTNNLTGNWDAGDYNITADWFTGSFNVTGIINVNHNFILYFDMSHWLNFEVAAGIADETLNIVPDGVLLQDRHYHRLTLGVDTAPGVDKFFNMSLTDGTNELFLSLTGAEMSGWTITGEFDWDASVETLTLSYSQTVGGGVNNAFVTIKYHYKENE